MDADPWRRAVRAIWVARNDRTRGRRPRADLGDRELFDLFRDTERHDRQIVALLNSLWRKGWQRWSSIPLTLLSNRGRPSLRPTFRRDSNDYYGVASTRLW
jgi:hypothetical protein